MERTNDPKLIELYKWQARILYEIGMAYNNLKKFKEAEVMARKSLKLHEIYNKDNEMEILSKILLSVIISSPQCGEYQESLDILKSARTTVKQKIDQLDTQLQTHSKSNDSNSNSNSNSNTNSNKLSKKISKTQIKQARIEKEKSKWQSQYTHINNLISKIIPFYIKSLKNQRGKLQPKIKSKAKKMIEKNEENKENKDNNDKDNGDNSSNPFEMVD